MKFWKAGTRRQDTWMRNMATDTGRNNPNGGEPRSQKAVTALVTILAMIVIGLVIHFGVQGLWTTLEGESKSADAAKSPVLTAPDRLPPEPRLQPDPVSDLHRLRQAEDDVLETYAWIDKDKGVVRIPVARAMSLLAQRGLPNWPTGQRPPAPPVAAAGK
jgi:hypothetical protein